MTKSRHIIIHNPIERFWNKVDKKSSNECWNWIGSKSKRGYGYFGFHRRIERVHRVSWILTYGDIPIGLCVLHKCDNRGCVNPNHLFLGTNADNMHDMKNKGRQASVSEEKNPNVKLSRNDVVQIKTLHASGEFSGAELARRFGVKPETVYHILNGMIWKNVEVKSEN